MKNNLIILSLILALIYIIGEPEVMTIKIFIIKLLCIFWIWLVAKANNYFYKGE